MMVKTDKPLCISCCLATPQSALFKRCSPEALNTSTEQGKQSKDGTCRPCHILTEGLQVRKNTRGGDEAPPGPSHAAHLHKATT